MVAGTEQSVQRRSSTGGKVLAGVQISFGWYLAYLRLPILRVGISASIGVQAAEVLRINVASKSQVYDGLHLSTMYVDRVDSILDQMRNGVSKVR